MSNEAVNNIIEAENIVGIIPKYKLRGNSFGCRSIVPTQERLLPVVAQASKGWRIPSKIKNYGKMSGQNQIKTRSQDSNGIKLRSGRILASQNNCLIVRTRIVQLLIFNRVHIKSKMKWPVYKKLKENDRIFMLAPWAAKLCYAKLCYL